MLTNICTLPSRTNFSVIFRVLYSSVITRLERKIDKTAISDGQLKLWEASYKIVNSLLDITKALDMPRIFSLFIKVNS